MKSTASSPLGWAATRLTWLARLERAGQVSARAIDLGAKAGGQVGESSLTRLRDVEPRLARQLQRLQENRFEVAVLGLENAGKSALLNGWLGVEILPSMDERCTYTPTEIWSAPSEKDQRYRLEFWSREEFDRGVRDREQRKAELTGDEAKRLENELGEIKRHRAEIDRYLDRAPFERPFIDIREVREELTHAIATDRAKNYACRRIQIFTDRLIGERDIVFHDVPGFDSPLRIHRDQAEARVAACDAILYAKRFDSPDLVQAELALLNVADREDPDVRSSEKVIIALTRCDAASSPKDREEKLARARSKWEGVASERIVPVCPPVHLFRKHTGGPWIEENGAGIEVALGNSTKDDGIVTLKGVVETYIERERAVVLQKRCAAIEAQVLTAATELASRLSVEYPSSAEDLDRAEEDAFDRAFNGWWSAQWSRIVGDFTHHFQQNVLAPVGSRAKTKDPFETRAPGAEAKDKPGLGAFRATYDSLLTKKFSTLPTRSLPSMERLYNSKGLGPDGIVLPERGHIEVRKQLAREVRDAVEDCARELALTLAEIAGQLAGKATELLWGVPEVRNSLLGASPDHARFEHGLSTLFLRFARPAVSLFVETPRLSKGREELVGRHGREIVLLKDFYDGADQKRRQLEGFLTVGEWIVLGAAAVGGAPAGAAKVAAVAGVAAINHFDESRKHWADPANFEQVRRQVEDDLAALEGYLRDSVFEAAAFSSYCQQELDRLKDRFLRAEEESREWQAVVRAALRRGHPGVVSAYGKVHQEREYRRGIVVALGELKTVLAMDQAG